MSFKDKVIRHRIRKSLVCKCKLNDKFIGTGAVNPDILIIGDPPKKAEVLLKQPFVGEGVLLLNEMIREACVELNYTKKIKLYYLNAMMCRPVNGQQERLPKQEELACCFRNVLNIIDILNPSMIVLVGDFAKKMYYKTFREATLINHYNYHIMYGGKGSPTYNIEIIRLKEAIFNYIELPF